MTCAVCTREVPVEFDADLEVMACDRCRFEHPREGRYTFASLDDQPGNAHWGVMLGHGHRRRSRGVPRK